MPLGHLFRAVTEPFRSGAAAGHLLVGGPAVLCQRACGSFCPVPPLLPRACVMYGALSMRYPSIRVREPGRGRGAVSLAPGRGRGRGGLPGGRGVTSPGYQVLPGRGQCLVDKTRRRYSMTAARVTSRSGPSHPAHRTIRSAHDRPRTGEPTRQPKPAPVRWRQHAEE